VSAPAAETPARVLIVKPSSLGDVVTALPVLRGLKRSFPAVHAAWLLSDSCAPLLEDDPDLDEVIVFRRRQLGKAWRSPAALRGLLALRRRLRAGRFDWAIDLQGLFRSGYFTGATRAPLRAGFADAAEGAGRFYTRRVQVAATHTVECNMELARELGIDARPSDMRLHVTAAGREFAEAVCRRHGLSPGDYVVCVPPARWQSKRWPVRHWRRLLRGLTMRCPAVLIGSPGERALCREIAAGGAPGVVDLAGQTSVPEMVGLIAASAGVISSDSAAKFIAPAVGVGCVTLIGPTQVERTGPYPTGRAVAAATACQGCLKRRCRHVTCMELIGAAEVLEAAEEMLAERKCV